MTLRQKAKRNETIKKLFDDGMEMEELAVKYQLSFRQIQNIITGDVVKEGEHNEQK